MSNPLEKEFQWYLENQKKLAEEYNGKVIVIKNCTVIGVFDSIGLAVEETSKEHEVGTFLVQKCSLGDQDTTAIFHTRVA